MKSGVFLGVLAFSIVLAASEASAITPVGPPASKSPEKARPAAKEITRIAKAMRVQFPLRSVLYGVWRGKREIVTGALGRARPGVSATTDDHFRIGNVTESMTTTALLQLVDQGRISLDDPLAKWMPELPAAADVRVGMLPRSTTGYPDYVTTPAYGDAYIADPFRIRPPSELLAYAFSRPPLFPPGSSWAFSDTNFTVLGELLTRVTGTPLPRLLRQRVFLPLGLRETQMRFDAKIPKPVLHGYTFDRGTYEDSTGWSPSLFGNAGNGISTLDDLGRWARALGTGRLLSPGSHALQTSPQADGLGVASGGRLYTMGSILANGWIHNNPKMLGYNGAVGYLPAKGLSVVVYTTPGPTANPELSYGTEVFNRIAARVAPAFAPNLPFCTRPPC